jgi:hypothetical protein
MQVVAAFLGLAGDALEQSARLGRRRPRGDFDYRPCETRIA